MKNYITVYSTDFTKIFTVNFDLRKYKEFGDYIQMNEYYYIDGKDFALISNGDAVFKYSYGTYFKSIKGRQDMVSCTEQEALDAIKTHYYNKDFDELLNDS